MSITRRHLVKQTLSAALANFLADESKSLSQTVKPERIDKQQEYAEPRKKSEIVTIADFDQLVGYATPLSVSPGQRVQFQISTPAPKVHYHFARLKKTYLGCCCLDMNVSGFWNGGVQPFTAYESTTDGCNWKPVDSTPFKIPPSWNSGIYAVYCVDSWGRDLYIPFVVRPPRQMKVSAPILIVANTNTWNAYNDFSGWSRYNFSGGKPDGEFPMSFERPNCHAQPFWPGLKNAWTQLGAALASQNDKGEWVPTSAYRFGLRDNFIELSDFNERHTFASELWFLNWLEDSGRRFDVCSDFDLHNDSVGLDRYKVLILTTHPEYWSQQAYENLAAFLKKKKKAVINLGGNGLYERVKYDSEGRMIVTGWATETNRTNLFTKERNLLGLSSQGSVGSNIGYLYEVTSKGSQNKCFVAAGFRKTGERFGSLGLNGRACGWEMDRASDPNEVDVLASGVFWPTPSGSAGDIVFKAAEGGGFVFSAASINFTGSLVVDHKLHKLIQAVISHALGEV